MRKRCGGRRVMISEMGGRVSRGICMLRGLPGLANAPFERAALRAAPAGEPVRS